MKKVKIPTNWPIERGRYLVGNPFSPAAVIVILAKPYDKIPKDVEELVRVAIETGAAIAGTLQTANIGIEKIIINIVSNPNIRHVILVGKECLGHYPGDAFKALIFKGVDVNRYIIGTKAPTAILKNISLEAVKRFRGQVGLVDLLGIKDPGILKEAVWTCYQEKETKFSIKEKEYVLYDPGAFSSSPLICSLSDKLIEE